MTYEVTDLEKQIEADLEPMSLLIASLGRGTGDDARFVAVMLRRPNDTLEQSLRGRVGAAVLDSWPEVLDVIAGLMDQATRAWGQLSMHAESKGGQP